MNPDSTYQRLREIGWRRPLTEAEQAELRAWLAAHPDHHRAGKDGIGQVTKPREGYGAVSWDFLSQDCLALHNTTASYSATTVARPWARAASSSPCGARRPTEQVWHSSSATPSCAQPGGT